MQTPVVLIHGMWSTGNTLRPIEDRFTHAGYETHAPTLPHHDKASNGAGVGAQSLTDYIAFLQKFIAEKNFATPPLLVGHSMGGLLSQMLAARIPTAGLVLFAPAPPPPGIPAASLSQLRFFFPITARPFWWKKPFKPASAAAANRALFTNLSPQRQRELNDELVHESGRVLFEQSFAMLDKRKATAHDFAAVKVPMLALHGTKDGVLPISNTRKLQPKYAALTVKEYSGAGHWLFEEAGTANTIFRDLFTWLDEKAIR